MEESSSKNAAIVLKITETSQGNVCLVDILDIFAILISVFNGLHKFTFPRNEQGRTADQRVY